MPEYTLRREQFIPTPIDEVFAFFADAGNLDFLTPPWLHFRIRTALPITMKTGTLIDYTIRWRLVPVTWRTEILDWSPPSSASSINRSRAPTACGITPIRLKPNRGER